MNPYSPERRTGLVLCGSGAHGAYHAGALKALQEAGVKIDLVAGQGVGAAGAALAAIDGGARLWEPGGVWRSASTRRSYGWNPLLGVIGWIAAALALVLLIPIIVLAIGVIVFTGGFLLTLVGIGAGQALTTLYTTTLQTAFADDNLPTIVPRLAMVVLAVLLLVAFAGVVLAQSRAPARRRSEGGWWWRLIGAPIDPDPARHGFASALWQLIRGAAAVDVPSSAVIGRRFAEVLIENLGQPGFREIVLVATDLDARRDVVAALLRPPFNVEFTAPRPDRDRRSEILDLSGIGRDHAFDVVRAALTPPLVCEPALVTFAAESYWRGETHRLCDRPGIVSRLLEEVAAAGVSQAIVVSAIAPVAAPHRLVSPRLDMRHRLGDFLAASEGAALRDALEIARLRFDRVYLVCPVHNPVGPFDFGGAYDETSDRHEDLVELMQHGYEDAYRQFIEPVVGASGEHLAATADGPSDAIDRL